MKTQTTTRLVITTLLLVMTSATHLKAQTEQAAFFADKKVCFPGDTLWLRLFLRDTVRSTTSTNFYVELYKDSERDTICVRRYIFPVKQGISMGQIESPDSAGIYWLRGFTLNSENELVFPFTVINSPKKVVVKELKDQVQRNSMKTNIVEFEKDSGGISIHLSDTGLFNYSLSITNAENPDVSIPFSRPVNREDLPVEMDSSYLTYDVSAGDNKFANQDMVIMVQKDTNTTPPVLVSLDDKASVTLTNLYFFDTAFVYYKLNNSKKAKESFSLTIHPIKYPLFIRPTSTSIYESESRGMFSGNDSIPFIIGKRTLKTFVVKSKWSNKNLELNKRYVMSPVFEPIEQFTYDMRDPGISRFNNLYEFMARNLPDGWAQNSIGFMSGSCREGVLWYEDEKRVSAQYINSQPLNRYAYFKAYSDLQPCPCILVYTRKGSDLKSLPSQMKTLAIKGYDKPLQWTSPDRITYHWNPYITDVDYKFKVPAKKFRIQIMGVKNDGKPFYYNSVLDEDDISIGTAKNAISDGK